MVSRGAGVNCALGETATASSVCYVGILYMIDDFMRLIIRTVPTLVFFTIRPDTDLAGYVNANPTGTVTLLKYQRK